MIGQRILQGLRLVPKRTRLVLKVVEVRLRFVAILVATGLFIGYYDTIKNYWDKWTRPAPAALAQLDAEHEFYCPMHPQVVRPGLEPNGTVPNCPICGMPLSIRRKGGPGVALPPGITGRVQLSPQRIELAGIQTVEVQRRPMSKQVVTVGEVVYDESRLSRIVSRVSGYVEKLYVDKTYAAVKRGDPLAEIYSPDLYSAAQELVLAQRSRMADLAASARKRLELLGVDPREIGQIADSGKASPLLVVRAPLDGSVIGKPIVTGARVEEGMTLLEIADIADVWIEAEVYENDIGLLRKGQAIEAQVEALPNHPFRGEVSLVYPRVESSTRTNRVRFKVENPGLALRPGMYATVRINVPLGQFEASRDPGGKPHVRTISAGESPNAAVVAVPESAVIDTGDKQIVYVEREPGLYEGVQVKLGPRSGGYYPVLSGLKTGDRVAAAGSFLIDAETRLNPAAASTYFGASGSKTTGSSPAPARPAAVASPGQNRPAAAEKLSPEAMENIAKLPLEDQPLALAQRVCPITGAALGSMGKPAKVLLEGQAVFLCCRGCIAAARKDAQAVLKKVNGPLP